MTVALDTLHVRSPGVCGSRLTSSSRTARCREVFDEGPDPRLEPEGTEAEGALGALLLLFTQARWENRWQRFKPCGHCREIFYDHTTNLTGRWCRTGALNRTMLATPSKGRRGAGASRSEGLFAGVTMAFCQR